MNVGEICCCEQRIQCESFKLIVGGLTSKSTLVITALHQDVAIQGGICNPG